MFCRLIKEKCAFGILTLSKVISFYIYSRTQPDCLQNFWQVFTASVWHTKIVLSRLASCFVFCKTILFSDIKDLIFLFSIFYMRNFTFYIFHEKLSKVHNICLGCNSSKSEGKKYEWSWSFCDFLVCIFFNVFISYVTSSLICKMIMG